MPFTDAVWNSIQCRIISQITGKDVEGNEVFTLKRRPAIRMERLNKIMHILRTMRVAFATDTAHILNRSAALRFYRIPQQQMCSAIQRTLSLSLSITDGERKREYAAKCSMHSLHRHVTLQHHTPAAYETTSHYPTNSMEQGPSWEAKTSSATQEIPAFYGTRMFITVFTRARHLSLS